MDCTYTKHGGCFFPFTLLNNRLHNLQLWSWHKTFLFSVLFQSSSFSVFFCWLIQKIHVKNPFSSPVIFFSVQKFQEMKPMRYFVSATYEIMSLKLYMPPAEAIGITLKAFVKTFSWCLQYTNQSYLVHGSLSSDSKS